MSAVTIDVQRLRLVAGRGAGAQGLRARVEDALRISSKPPGLAHRFLLIRRLRLSLPREASAQSLSLRLEQQWRRLEALAQPMANGRRRCRSGVGRGRGGGAWGVAAPLARR